MNTELKSNQKHSTSYIHKHYYLLYIIIITFISTLFIGCKNKVFNENSTAFTMSSSMMNKCKFYEVKKEDVKNDFRFFGKIEANNNKTAQVFSSVGGLVTSINAGLGDYVNQGDVLATIQSSEIAEFQKQKLDAINNVAIAEKNLAVAKDLYVGKLNSERDIIAAEKELEKAKAELVRINEIYNIYNIKSNSVYSVLAPMSGFVITKNIFINELLRPNEEDALFSIANTNEIWAVAFVNESNISQIKEGYDATVNTLAYPNITYIGKIEKIYNVIDASTKSMKFRVPIQNDGYNLKPDMNCTVNVQFSENKEMTCIPTSSIIFDKNKYWVMVFKDRHNIETRQVEIYNQIGDKTYISSGLNEEETIISENGILIYDALND